MKRPFIRLETHARTPRLPRIINGKERVGKRSAAAVAAEADRVPYHAPHIDGPKPPNLLYGPLASKVVTALCMAVDDRKREHLARTNRKLRVRKDQQMLIAGVVSYPEARRLTESSDAQLKEYRRWRTRVVRFLRSRFKDALRCVIEHVDEPRLHLHFFCVPDVPAGEMTLHQIHPGMKASRDCGPRDTVPKKAREDAWVRAMRNFQLEFYHQVSWYHGHTLRQARKQRLSRAEVRAQEQQLKALAEAKEHASELLLAADMERRNAKAEASRLLEEMQAERKLGMDAVAAELAAARALGKRLEAALALAASRGINLSPKIGDVLKDVAGLDNLGR